MEHSDSEFGGPPASWEHGHGPEVEDGRSLEREDKPKKVLKKQRKTPAQMEFLERAFDGKTTMGFGYVRYIVFLTEDSCL